MRTKHLFFLVGIAAPAITASMGRVPQARAQEPVEWCQTYVNWAANGDPTASAQGTCPTFGTCDEPSVRDSWIPESSTPVVTIRLKFNVFCDGTDCASTTSSVDAQMLQLNGDFGNIYLNDHRIQFVHETQFIDDSRYRDVWGATSYDPMKLAWAGDNPMRQINIYITEMQNDNEGPTGLATFPWDDTTLTKLGGIVIDDSYIGAGYTTLTHEIGHSLGLWHTFRGVSEVAACSACYERAHGTDGDVTGDFCADTPSTRNWTECSDPDGEDYCYPGTLWAPTQRENFMAYTPESCRTKFTAQQAGRMHCWIRDRLLTWIACMSDADCDDRDACTEDRCFEGTCRNDTEVPGLTCNDGIDNDCDGYADCDDGDCVDDPGCRCYDNGGTRPLVCLEWTGASPPARDFNFEIDTANPPNVTFRTGNDGWRVWSQVSRTNSAAGNLGHVKVDPTSITENFSVAIAHGASPGAAAVASLDLTKPGSGWTGYSRLSGSISGTVNGNLILQESGGQGGHNLQGSR